MLDLRKKFQTERGINHKFSEVLSKFLEHFNVPNIPSCFTIFLNFLDFPNSIIFNQH